MKIKRSEAFRKKMKKLKEAIKRRKKLKWPSRFKNLKNRFNIT